jgi:DNA-directed RNA polymerase specialized sigma24 family protein/ribosome-associated translation inhibitor RaiA
MKTVFAFQATSPQTRQSARRFFAEKLAGLAPVLGAEDLEEARARVVLRGPREGTSRWEVRIVLKVRAATLLVAEASQRGLRETLDAVAAAFGRQLRALRSRRRRRRHGKAPSARERATLAGLRHRIPPPDAPAAEAARAEASVAGGGPSFREFADEHRDHLRERAARALATLESSRRMPRHRRSVDGVADEALLLAWERRGSLRAGSDARVWLDAVLDEVLAGAVEHAAQTTPAVVPPAAGDDELDPDPTTGQWLQHCLLTEHDPEIWEDRFPARLDGDRVGRVTEDEEKEAILQRLVPLAEEDRAAFRLHAFEGYAEDEIAMLQGRGVEEVRRALEAARAVVQRSVLA